MNCHTSCSSNEVFFRCEGHCSCSRIDCVSSFTCYCHRCFVSRLASCWIYQFLACDFSSLIATQIKGWCLGLRNVLNVRRNLVCRSHCDWSNCWCVFSCCCLKVFITDGTVFIFSDRSCYGYGNTLSCTCESWFWNKGYFTSSIINAVCSFACYCYRGCIGYLTSRWVHQFSRIFQAWSDRDLFAISISCSCVKGWCTGLSSTLDICRSLIYPFNIRWCNSWDIKTIHGI